MLVCVCSDRGSPGVTSTALTLAATWPERAVLVEADASGGDLGIRMRHPSGAVLPPTPTLLTLAAAARAEPTNPHLVAQTAVAISERLAVIPAHLAAEKASGISGCWEALARALACSDVDVIADVGRIHAGSPTMPIAAAADLVLVVGRADPESVIHLRERVVQLVPVLAQRRERPPRVGVVLVAPQRHAHAHVQELGEVLEVAGVQVAGVGYVAYDPGSVQRLEEGEDPERRLGRSLLVRTGRRLARSLHRTGSPAELVEESS